MSRSGRPRAYAHETIGYIVDSYGRKYCPRCSEGDHKAGWADISNGVIHMTPRRIQRQTLLRVLVLIGDCVLNLNRGQPVWQKMYQRNHFAQKEANIEYHVRFTTKDTKQDRIRAFRARPPINEMPRRAYIWAYRGWREK